jgi:hypothetical protein
MEPTIVQNGALFALQHGRAKGKHRRFHDLAKVQPKRLFFRLPLDRINWFRTLGSAWRWNGQRWLEVPLGEAQ